MRPRISIRGSSVRWSVGRSREGNFSPFFPFSLSPFPKIKLNQTYQIKLTQMELNRSHWIKSGKQFAERCCAAFRIRWNYRIYIAEGSGLQSTDLDTKISIIKKWVHTRKDRIKKARIYPSISRWLIARMVVKIVPTKTSWTMSWRPDQPTKPPEAY